MKTIILNNSEASDKKFAFFLIKNRNAQYECTFSYKFRRKAQNMFDVLGSYFYDGKIHEPHYNKTGISIKAEGSVKDKALLAEYETYWAEQGIIKKISPQGTIYWIPKKAKV